MHTSILSLLSNVDLNHPYDHALLELVQDTLDGCPAVTGLEPLPAQDRPCVQDEPSAGVPSVHDTLPWREPLHEGNMRLMTECGDLLALVLMLDLKLSRFATLVQRAFPGAGETLCASLGVTTHQACLPTGGRGPKRPSLRCV
jgi:hypothetical protein